MWKIWGVKVQFVKKKVKFVSIKALWFKFCTTTFLYVPVSNAQWQCSEGYISCIAVSLFHFQIMLLIQKETVLQCRSSLPIWRLHLELIHFGLVAQKRSWRVLVKWVMKHLSPSVTLNACVVYKHSSAFFFSLYLYLNRWMHLAAYACVFTYLCMCIHPSKTWVILTYIECWIMNVWNILIRNT